MVKLLAALVAKLHKLLRVLVRVQLSHDRTVARVGKRDPKTGTFKVKQAGSFVLTIRLGAGAGYVWPNFFRLPGSTFFFAWRAKNYHTNPRQFSTPLCVRVTRNANHVPVPEGVGCWKTLDLF